MQSHALAEIGKANSGTMASDFFQNAKGATEGLNTRALPIQGIVNEAPMAGPGQLDHFFLYRRGGLFFYSGSRCH